MKQYQPLYLKYRPQTLSELVGQEVVSKTLTNAINYNKIVHAYLFCGPRGTGKTSSARILAKSLNCEKGVSVDPCGKCVSCESIANGSSLDVIEIDAASHRKVEDAEDLINRVNLATYGSRYKIYIIDEVHMLTDHAFNALLKTLEEPPKNVIFILATTEEYKVIPTIISRCQKLDFKSVPGHDLARRIKEIVKKENINIDESIVSFISKRANGCLRDAVSLLDQISVLQVEDKKIESKEVFELFGTVDRTTLLKLIEAILVLENKKSIDLAEELVKSGKDVEELFKSMLELMIDLSKAKIDLEYKKFLQTELSSDLAVLDKIKQNHLLKIVNKLQDAQAKLRFALSQELQFMVEIMGLLDEDFLVSLTELKERLEKLENGTSKPKDQKIIREQEVLPKPTNADDSNTIVTESPNPLVSESLSPPTPPSNVAISQTPISELDSLWPKIVGFIESNPTKTLLNQSESYLLSINDELLEVGLSKDIFLPRLEKDEKKKEMILEATKIATGISTKSIKFRFLPRPKQKVETKEQVSDISPSIEEQPQSPITKSKTRSNEPADDFTRAIEDLLGAKPID